ncbi:hypothetical protein [Actinomadura rubrisoli]|uniref:DUF3291 domain-containing protein n=1 Tax=Actinomadura rubrisoli TaxID=2530368 RepID=A0A4R5A347_9ACTN|nr:hypothetical protein [Actinomadura rubrisoli]TDD66253.1 hypothetical protein E1298_40530 [Actinomadura rubrisoli]
MELRTSWRRGPAKSRGPILVSVTDFTGTARDLPRIYRAGLELRRAWPDLEGAVGLWLWTRPLQRRSGSVSIWTTEADLHRFVAWPPHVAIMRRFRHRGRIRAHTWEVDHFDPGQIWARAHQLLDAQPEAPSHTESR